MKELILALILSVSVSFAIFGNGISGDFVFDDVTVIQNRGDLTNPDNFFNLFISPYHQNSPKTGLFRPLTMASYSLNHLIFGSSPVSFHVVNIIIHALNSALVFWLIRYFYKSDPVPWIAFLLFLSHPIHTEAVTSIVGRAELLAFFWALATALLFLKGKRVLAGVSFLLALMSKEVAVMVWPILLFIEWSVLGGKFIKSVKNILFLVVPFAVYSLMRYFALGQYFSGDISTTIVENPLKFTEWPERIYTALKVLYMYAARLIWPQHLSADYSYNSIHVVSNILRSPEAIVGAVVLAALVWSLVNPKIRGTGYGLAAVLFLAPYIIISNIIVPVGTIMGERLMYFPSLGFVLFVALLFSKFAKRHFHKPALAALVIILAAYGLRTIVRNQDWHDARALFSAAAKESSDSLIIRTALAGVYIREGEWSEAKEQLDAAQAIHKDNSHLQNLLGIVADHDGDTSLAEAKFKKSLELNPDAINSYINLGELYIRQNRFEEAAPHFLKVIDFYAKAEYVIRYAYIEISINNPNTAIEVIDKHFGLGTDNPDALSVIGTAYFVKGDYQQAVYYLKKAQELGNNIPDIADMIRRAERAR